MLGYLCSWWSAVHADMAEHTNLEAVKPRKRLQGTFMKWSVCKPVTFVEDCRTYEERDHLGGEEEEDDDEDEDISRGRAWGNEKRTLPHLSTNRNYNRISTPRLHILKPLTTMALTYYALTFITGAVLLLLLRHHLPSHARRSAEQALFPKGPPTLPLLGNLHQLARPKAFLSLTAWARDSSTSTPTGLVGLRLGGGGGGRRGAVVLSKWTHVRDLFDARGRGAIYADRPRFAVAERVITGGDVDLNVVLSRHNARWRRGRRTIVGFLGDAAMARGVERVQDAEGCQMVWELWQFCGEGCGAAGAGGNESGGGGGGEEDEVSGPRAYHRYSMRYSGAVILASVFGVRGKEAGPRGWAGRFFSTQDEFVQLLEGGIVPPLEIFPWLKYVPDFLTPWKGWRKRVDSLSKAQSGLYHDLVSETVARMEAGKAQESFMATTIKNQEAAMSSGRTKDIYTRLELDYIGGFLMEAGADTSTMAFESFLLAMIAHPEIQKEAQGEIDAIYGPEEMPHTCDGKKLPFLKACFLEVSSLTVKPRAQPQPFANSLIL